MSGERGRTRAASYRSLWRLRTYVRPYRPQMALMLVCATVAVAASTFIPLILEAVVDGPIARGDRGELIPMFLIALGLGCLEAALIVARRRVQSIAIVKVEREIRNNLYARLQKLPVEFHDRWQTGQLLSRTTTDLSTIRRFLGFGAIFFIVDGLQYLAVMALLIATYVPLGLVAVVTTLPVIWLAKNFGHGYSSISRRVQDQQGDLATLTEEAATGMRVVKAFGRGPLMQARFGGSARVLRGSALELVKLRARFWGWLTLVPNVTMAAAVLIGGLAVARGALTVGALVAFTTLLVLLQFPIIDLGWILSMAQEAGTAADRVCEIFDAAMLVDDRPGAVPLVKSTGRLVFENVGFSYPGATTPVLRDITLTLEPGETVAIVGLTGSGKSTLASLPARLYDVTTGRITLDGVDVRDMTLESLRDHVAVVFEDPVLFSMSVRENLVLGRADASEGDIAEALELAQAGYVYDLPWGLDTRIGEQGLSLSGGQRQRLALARAVIARPSVLVLDDPLSALDVHTEALVEESLARVLREVTGLLVVHRPSTVALANRVALLRDGVLVAVGTHHQLMERPDYASVLSVNYDRSGAQS
ncbi:MAG TPA: ABC transporter ATP-binding protein [Acidimicrobiales bacterium]|jgi:ATP-binding cassette subfamily B protein|nr:ABC transporter ATP-binding protein [Acidimicrobiales bacterium]